MNTLNKENTEKTVYTIPQVAEILQQSPEAVRRYVAAGKLAAQKEGKKYIVSKADLYKFLK